jgi:D-inositol-3-phosphate glycosyltransferase
MPVSNTTESTVEQLIGAEPASAGHLAAVCVTVLTGGIDPPYVYGLTMELVAQGLSVELIGSDELDRPEMHSTPGVTFVNLYGSSRKASCLARILRVFAYYARLIRYAAKAKPRIFHILWNNKFVYFDRTFLTLYYKLLGKKLVFTAHNVNAARRDENDSWLNRVTLKMQYRGLDHIFVHTEMMRDELLRDFGVREQAITVIPFGINNSVPDTGLSPAEARRRLGIAPDDKTILFFGRIRPYKGLMYLVEAFQRVVEDESYRLIIAGEPKKDAKQYWEDVQEKIARGPKGNRIMQRLAFIPDVETELYYKAADVSVLPYTMVFQSGVLFLSHSFGLPVIASDVGSLRDDIVEGKNGLLCKPRDSHDLARAIVQYFDSELYRHLPERRPEIRAYAKERHSWSVVGARTREVYTAVLGS